MSKLQTLWLFLLTLTVGANFVVCVLVFLMVKEI